MNSFLRRFVLAFASAAIPAVLGFDADDFSSTDTPLQPSHEFMLTFDDGPLPGATERVLEALAELRASDGKSVRAGFFLVGDAPEGFWQSRYYYSLYEIWTAKGSIVKYPHIARRIHQAGHLVGNHTAHHAWFRWPWLGTFDAVWSELAQWEMAAEPVFGSLYPPLFRPPYSIDSEVVCEVTRRSGYQIVMGEAVGDATPAITEKQLEDRVQGILETWQQPYPCVLIFHDILPVTYEHLGAIVGHLQQRGFLLAHFDPARLPKDGGCVNR